MYLVLLSSEKIGRLNELWDQAVFNIEANDLSNFKKLIVENKELLNWQHEEHVKSTLLRGICERDDRAPFIEYLLSCEGIDVDMSDRNGFSACMIASGHGHSFIVSMLLDRGGVYGWM